MGVLEKYLGTPYQREDEQGNYLGCLLPMYVLYPDVPRFPLPEKEPMKFFYEEFKKYFKPINKRDIKKYDIIMARLPSGILHIAVYNGNNKVIQTSRGIPLTQNNADLQDKRIIGVFKYGR